MKNIFAPLIIGIAMLGVLSVVFGPSSRRGASHAQGHQRTFNTGFDSGVISALMVLKDKVAADPYELNARAAAWWNAQGGGGWQHTTVNTAASNIAALKSLKFGAPASTNATLTVFTNVVVRGPVKTVTDADLITGPPVNTHGLGKVDDATLVNRLVTDGTFCKVRGHSWGAHMHVTLEHVPSRVGCRECKVCGLHQEQYASEWK